ncbi:hypothetical protein D3C87_1899990 [compost metagenome]
MQVVHFGGVGGLVQINLAGEQVGQAAVHVHAEHFVQVAFTHVGVDQQHLLSGLGNDRGQVARYEGFTHGRAWAGNHQDVVLRFKGCEVQAGTQAAQRFDGEVGGVVDGEQQ